MSGADDFRTVDSDAAAPLRIEVMRGHPTAEELAAVVAVVTEAYEREASSALAADAPRESAWSVSTRALRAPLRRDLGWTRGG